MKDKIIRYVISILFGQIVAFIGWYFFNLGAISFVEMFVGSIAGAYFGYKKPEKKQNKVNT